MAKNGNDILIYRGNTLIAGTRSNEITTNAETIEVSSAINGQWKTFIAGRKDWSVTVNYLVPAVTNVSDLLTVGTSYTISVRTRSGSTVTSRLSGTAILKTCKITATKGNLIQGSFQFAGSGPLSAST